LLAVAFAFVHLLLAHFNPICYEGADYVEQYPHQDLPDKHIVSQETMKVPLFLSTIAKWRS
jgi:hypothetical protein